MKIANWGGTWVCSLRSHHNLGLYLKLLGVNLSGGWCVVELERMMTEA